MFIYIHCWLGHYNGFSSTHQKVILAMEAITGSLESSLPVPSVKELALQRPEKVPARYIRDSDGDDVISTVSSDPSLRVPVIDMAKLVNALTQEEELQKLHLACKDWGVFQVLLQQKHL